MKRHAMGHPKLVRLAMLLGVPLYAVVGIMECIWHFTQKHAITGDIGKWTDEEIAGQIGWETSDASRLIEALVTCRLLDRHSTHRLVVHDWNEHCDESVTKTLRNKGLSFANKSVSAPLPSESSPLVSEPFAKILESDRNVLPKPSLSLAKPKPTPSSPKLRSEEGDRDFATFMVERIRKLQPNFKQPNVEAWGNTIRLAREIDGRTLEELRSVFVWANGDSFWQANILSPDKLREKFDALQIKRKGPTNGTARHAEPSAARPRSGRYSDPSKYRNPTPEAGSGEPQADAAHRPLSANGEP